MTKSYSPPQTEEYGNDITTALGRAIDPATDDWSHKILKVLAGVDEDDELLEMPEKFSSVGSFELILSTISSSAKNASIIKHPEFSNVSGRDIKPARFIKPVRLIKTR